VSERRRVDGRSKRLKAEAVGLSVVEGVRPAARKMGIPVSTLIYWRESEEFEQLRTRKKEEVQAEVYAAFQTGVRRVVELMPKTEDMSKVAIATGILFDKFALMSGQATQRTEHADVTAKLDDHETAQLADAIEGLLESAK
jgi:hypothetical protein